MPSNEPTADIDRVVTRPLSLTLLLIAVAILIVAVVPAVRRRREEIFAEDD